VSESHQDPRRSLAVTVETYIRPNLRDRATVRFVALLTSLDMFVRPREDVDSEPLLAIAQRVHNVDGYPPYFPHLDFQILLFGHETLGAWVCETQGEVIGQVALHPHTGMRAMELAASSLAVHTEKLGVVARLIVSPEHRRKGIGQTLLERAATEAVTRGLYPMLDVATHLRSAVDLYEHCSWLRAGKVSRQFADGTTLDEFVYLGPPALRSR
jgi:GNAT superfamily N-acetyltransferase